MLSISSSLVLFCGVVCAADANRLTYLDEYADPYHPGVSTARLVTPQWVGEKDVDAVIALTIDDLRDVAKYEQFLRPIFQRLKQIDGRAPVSIFTNQVPPGDPQIQAWLREGVSLEAHTVDHPCPCLHEPRSLAWSKETYDRCIDELAAIPNQRTVAYRMPCCDSMPSVSPRFYTEIFNRTTPEGRFLLLDSSVMNVFTPDDPALPEGVCRDDDGGLRFDKYLPRDRGLWNWVENYPYPFVIARLCWQIPAATPDDWQGYHLQGNGHPTTIQDMQVSLDATVMKQGVFTLLFHPHGWISSDQVNQLVDHAVERHGSRVMLLTMREIHERLTRNLLAGQSLRNSAGADHGVRLLDLNHDGYMDVVIGNPFLRQTRIWDPDDQEWITSDFPVTIMEVDEEGQSIDMGVRFGVLQENGCASFLVSNESTAGLWHFDGQRWVEDESGLKGLELDGPIHTAIGGIDHGVRLRDLDRDGRCEVIVGNPTCRAVFAWLGPEHGFQRLPFTLPDDTLIVDSHGLDAGLRFVDLDGDGHDDIVFSNAERYRVAGFTSMREGWSRPGIAGRRGNGDGPDVIPPIVRSDGTNNGAWFRAGHLWVQNEWTGKRLPQHSIRLAYTELLPRVP